VKRGQFGSRSDDKEKEKKGCLGYAGGDLPRRQTEC